jgi:hypothetical protein
MCSLSTGRILSAGAVIGCDYEEDRRRGCTVTEEMTVVVSA